MNSSAADFTLLFKADGSVELLDRHQETVWSSDNDDRFSEEFDGETFFSDDDDSEDIIDYLDEIGLLDASTDQIDIVENDLSDESDDDVIDADYKEIN